MALAYSKGPRCASIVATDQRHSAYWSCGSSRRLDAGGKLLKLGPLWLALGGDALTAALAWERLIALDPPDGEAVCLALAALAETAPAEIARRWPGIPSNPGDASNYLMGQGSTVAAIRWNGELLHAGHTSLCVAYPHGYPDGKSTPELRDREHNALEIELITAGSAWSLIRAIAAEFAKVAKVAASVSPGIEIGMGEMYLTGDSHELATATDADLQAALSAPPKPLSTNPFPAIIERYVQL